MILRYRASGPGGQDDAPLVVDGVFTTLASIDPDSTHTLYLRLDNTGSSRTLFETRLAAGGFWSQRNPGARRWRYRNRARRPTMGVNQATVRELPAGSGYYRLDVAGHETTIDAGAAPLAVPGDGVRIVVEIEAGGVGECFEATVSSCQDADAFSQRCGP